MEINVQEFSVGTSMRHFADKLFDLIESIDVETVAVDFSDTEFVSRSFVQQYLLRKSTTKASIIEKNCSEAVKRMFTLVEKNERNEQRFDFDSWKVEKLTTA